MTALKYLKLFAIANEADLDKLTAKMQEPDKKQFIKIMVQFFQQQKSDIDINDFIQFSQEQLSQ